MGEYFREHREGVIGTILFHVIVILMLVFFKFVGIFPPPGEEGILVEFGTTATGRGNEQPAARRAEPEPTRTEPVEETVPVTPPQPVQTQPSKPVEEPVVTQDLEETAALEEARKKQEEEARRQKQLEDERKRQEAEAEKQRLAELERQRKEAEEKKKKEEEEARKIAEINNRVGGALSNTGTSSGSGTGQSQGVTFPGGNQGSPTGASGGQGQGGSGSGAQGKGPSFSLTGRTAVSLPLANYPGQEEGIVVVNITVDKYGNVTQATAGARGSTTMNQQLLEAARKAALQAKFNADNNAAAYQTGTITYRFTITQ